MVTVPVLFLLLSAFSPLVHSLTTFHVIPGNMTWTEAQEACRENFTDLVTVYSDKNNTALGELMMNNSIPSAWIGLSRTHFSQKWSNGDCVTYRNLTGDCGSLPCCAAIQNNGTWDSPQCINKYYFMCYKDDSSQTRNYHLILEKKTWYEAQSYCRENYTDLVSIRDQEENEDVTMKGLNVGNKNPFWIGLLKDDWEWSDGGNSTYRHWTSVNPSSSSSSPHDCVILSGGSKNWSSVSCSNNHSALCYYSSIHVSDEALNWEEALGYCQKEKRGGLLQIESEDHQKDVKRELQRRCVNDPVWVGLRQSRLFGFWIWPDGKAVFPYSNWDGGEPPEHQVSQHCGAVDPQREYRWRDMNCQTQYRVLCYSTCS